MSNLLKRGTTTISEERIIDYNELIKLKLKNIANDRENHGNVDADGFVKQMLLNSFSLVQMRMARQHRVRRT